MRIVLCGEVYSGNLGDGILHDSLSYLIRRADASVEVAPLDLSGRSGPSTGRPRSPGPLQRLNRSLLAASAAYRRLMARVAWLRVSTRIETEMWRPILRDADLLVLGGGNLLIDNDLNFPLKIDALMRCARDCDVSPAVLACGVGHRWSRDGRRLVAGALEGAAWLGVRDEPSRENLSRLLNRSADEIVAAPDPAVWAADVYGISRDLDSRTTGLGLTAPRVLRRHAPDGRFDADALARFWVDLGVALRRDGREIVLFGNGAPEDHAFARVVGAAFEASGHAAPRMLDRPRDPETLVRAIAGFDSIVAHRLHANVTAYALGVPAVGLGWDPKLKAFGAMTGRETCVLEGEDAVVSDTVATAVAAARDAGVDPDGLFRHKRLAAEAVAHMLAHVCDDADAPGGSGS